MSSGKANIGDCLRKTRCVLGNANNAEAVDSYRKMLEASEHLARARRKSTNGNAELPQATTRSRLRLYGSKSPSFALEALLKANAIRRKLAETHPEDVEIQREFAWQLRGRGRHPRRNERTPHGDARLSALAWRIREKLAAGTSGRCEIANRSGADAYKLKPDLVSRRSQKLC